MLETQRVDARSHFVRNVHQLEISLAIPARFRALNENAQNGQIESVPSAAIDDELSSPAGQCSNDLGAQTATIRPIEILRESNPIHQAILLIGWLTGWRSLTGCDKHQDLLCLVVTQRRAESWLDQTQRPCQQPDLAIHSLSRCSVVTCNVAQHAMARGDYRPVAHTPHLLWFRRDGVTDQHPRQRHRRKSLKPATQTGRSTNSGNRNLERSSPLGARLRAFERREAPPKRSRRSTSRRTALPRARAAAPTETRLLPKPESPDR
jgi:hypothetical protein